MKFDEDIAGFYADLESKSVELKTVPFRLSSGFNFAAQSLRSFVLSTKDDGSKGRVDIYRSGKLEETIDLEINEKNTVDYLLGFDMGFYQGSEEMCLVAAVDRVF